MITYTFLALIIVFSLVCFNSREAMAKYMFHPYSIHHHNEHYRFLTHAFIHGDFLHLAFNCIAFFSFGITLEHGFFSDPQNFDPRIGKIYYIILFTGGIYAASITEYLLNKNNPSYSSLGASGAISSVLFCYILVSPNETVGLFFVEMKGWIMGLLLLIVSFYLIQRKKKGKYSDNISHESHFWGALFGVVFTLILKPSLAKDFYQQILNFFA